MTDRKSSPAFACDGKDVFALARREIAERDEHIAALTARIVVLEASLKVAVRTAAAAERQLATLRNGLS